MNYEGSVLNTRTDMIHLERLVKHGFDVSGKKIEFSIHIFELINITPVVTLQQVIHFQVMTITYISKHHSFPFSLKWDSVVTSNKSLLVYSPSAIGLVV